jgi:HSP20 family protein
LFHNEFKITINNLKINIMELMTKTNGTWLPNLLDNIFDESLDSQPLRKLRSLPAVNIIETDNEFSIEFAAPGKKREEFNIELDNELLTISSSKEEKPSSKEITNYTRREFSYNSFKRSFTLPETVNLSKIDASYTDGILTVNLPKSEEAKKQPKRLIDIK